MTMSGFTPCLINESRVSSITSSCLSRADELPFCRSKATLTSFSPERAAASCELSANAGMAGLIRRKLTAAIAAEANWRIKSSFQLLVMWVATAQRPRAIRHSRVGVQKLNGERKPHDAHGLRENHGGLFTL